MSDERKSIEDLVDEMIEFTEKAGGNIDMYLGVCERAVKEAKSKLDGSEEAQTIYDESLEFLRIATMRYDEQ